MDLTDAGAVVVIADGSENCVSGTNIFRMLKTVYKVKDSDEEIPVQKKMRKLDGAFYSCVSMVIEGGEKGTGTLEITGGFEGLDSELHLAVNGGIITVNSRDDGINVNEDDISVVFFNGGEVTLNAALGEEGDGVDSNGYIVLNGGTLSVNGVVPPDSALDSDCGITYNGGTLLIDGEEQSYTPGEVFHETGMGPGGMGRPDGGPFGGMGFPGLGLDLNSLIEGFDLKDFREKVNALPDDATLLDVIALLGVELPDLSSEPPELPNGERPGGDQPGNGQKPGEKPAEDPDGDSWGDWDGWDWWQSLWDAGESWWNDYPEDHI